MARAWLPPPGAGYVVAIFPRVDDVMLSFEWGVDLPDPHGVLEGHGRRLRAVRLRPGTDPDAAVLSELVDAAIALGHH